MNKLKVKICGLTQAANVAAVSELHPDYLGFIFYSPSPRYISQVSAELIKYVPLPLKTVGVVVNEDFQTTKSLIQQHQLKAIQLHGQENPDFCAAIKAENIEVIKAFGVHDSFDFSKLDAYQSVVDYFLFDTQSAGHGGSGKRFDWTLLEKYHLDKPYFLSGGIGPEHAQQIKQITDERLYAIDLNSRFEVQAGLKNVDELEEFLEKLSI